MGVGLVKAEAEEKLPVLSSAISSVRPIAVLEAELCGESKACRNYRQVDWKPDIRSLDRSYALQGRGDDSSER